MSSKTFLKLKTTVTYNLLKAELHKSKPDLKVIGGDGSVQYIHKDLLRCVSSKFYHALEYSKEKGHDLEYLGAIKMPGLDEYGLKCLYDLLYKGFHFTDPSKADDVITRLNNLDIPLINQESNGTIENESKVENDVHTISRNSSRHDAQRKQKSNVQNDGRNDSSHDAHNNLLSDNYSPKPPSSTDSTDSSWSNRLRIRKRKIFTSSSADESDAPIPTPSIPKTNPTKTPNPTKTSSLTTTNNSTPATSTPSKITESPSTFATPISASRRSSKLISTPNDDNEEPNAISQEDRDIQRITSVIKSFLPHPACFLVEDGNLECFVCGEIFRYRDNWRRHLLEQHFHLTFLCPTCGQKFKRRGKCSEHMLRCR